MNRMPPKVLSNALGKILGIIVGLLYTKPIYELTLDYFIAQISGLLSLGYVMWSFIWLVLVFLAVVTLTRCTIVMLITFFAHFFTGLLVRLSLPRRPKR
ncbi:hypothetical protein [Agarilytica rhodophyticola]|uniref:hypothetical protein n=1 Tax=Agarilytica rhodophyticola TaxID=1737490 RepID=UPI000B341226|nr:hypothetical protein [Agarilytica rhodophyticola]